MNKFEITAHESLFIQRLHYIHKSNEIFCKLLAHELAEYPDDRKKEVLYQYANECRKSFVELDYARDQIIHKYLGDIKTDTITYTFNFDTHEVSYDL